MYRSRKNWGHNSFSYGLKTFCFLILFFGLCGTTLAFTVPVMVDYFDTGTFEANDPRGITYISSSGNYALVDYANDRVYITNPSGIKQSEFDISAYCNNPIGITYIPASGYFAIVDSLDDEVYIVDSSGTLQDHFDTGFVSDSPMGIVYNPDTDTGSSIVVDNANPTFALFSS